MEPQTAQTSPQNPPKPFFKNQLFYFLIAAITVILVGGYFLLPILTKEKSTGPEYNEGLEKEQVAIAILEGSGGNYPLITFDVDSLAMNSNVYEGLTIIRKGRVSPGLAESWSNPDPNTWRIKLRKNIKFHTGDILKARDVKFTIEEAKKNKDWVNNFIAVRVDSVKVVDDFTVDLKTKNPDATLLHWLVWVFILSEDQVKRDGVDKAAGTGPYNWFSADRKEPTLRVNNSYWGGTPKVKNIKYRVYKDDKAIIAGMEKGEADIGLIQEADATKQIVAKGFRLVTAQIGDISFLGFDTMSEKTKYVDKDKNPLASAKVRRAVMLAVDVPELLKKSGRLGSPISQIGGSDLVGYNSSLIRPKLDRDQAKKLLSEAGFPDGFTVTLDLGESAKLIGEEIKVQLAEVGVIVNLNPIVDFNELFEKIFSDSSFFLLSYLPDTLDSFDLLNSFIHTPDDNGNGFNNFRGYSNPELDKQLEEAAATFDTKERSDKTREIHKIVVEELPFVPLSTRIVTFTIRDDVAFEPAPFGYIFGFELSGRQKASSSN